MLAKRTLIAVSVCLLLGTLAALFSGVAFAKEKLEPTEETEVVEAAAAVEASSVVEAAAAVETVEIKEPSFEEKMAEFLRENGEDKETRSNGLLVSDVKMLQYALVLSGYDTEVTGEYLEDTDAAVRRFQRDNDLEVDGIAGENTMAKLRVSEFLNEPATNQSYFPLAGSGTDYRVVVNTGTATIFVYYWNGENWETLLNDKCAVGASWSPTPTGRFNIGDKTGGFPKGGLTYYFMTTFYGEYGFHSVGYDGQTLVDTDSLGRAVSHGCVRLSLENAKWLQDTVPSGSDVLIF